MNEFKQTLTSITRNISKVSGELIKTTKINLSISGEEDRLKSVYVDIGKKVHEIYLYGGGLGKFFDEKYLEICEIEKKLLELRGQLSVASGTRPCPKCKKQVEKDSDFCSKCGAKMDVFEIPVGSTDHGTVMESPERVVMPQPDILPEEPTESVHIIAPVSPPPERMQCKSCGAEYEYGDKYCLSCGRMV